MCVEFALISRLIYVNSYFRKPEWCYSWSYLALEYLQIYQLSPSVWNHKSRCVSLLLGVLFKVIEFVSVTVTTKISKLNIGQIVYHNYKTIMVII